MGTAREQLLILISTPLYLVVIGPELFISKLRKQDTYSFKDTAQNICFMLLNGGLDLLFRVFSIGIVLSFVYDHRVADPIHNSWRILVHTEKINKLGFPEYILVTPSHHGVYHGSNPRYLDRNMGMLLIIWDKLFGTFQPELRAEEYQAIRYGLTKPLEREDPLHLVMHEWKSIGKDLSKPGLSFRQRWNYLFGPPGWSHDGSSRTSTEMRR